MDELDTLQDNLQNATVDQLKDALQKAVEERKQADAKISSIRKAISNYVKESEGLLKEIQGLSDAAGTVAPLKTTTSASDYFTLDFGQLFGWFLRYVIPAVLMLLIIIGLVRAVKNKAKTGCCDRGVNVVLEVQEANQTLFEV